MVSPIINMPNPLGKAWPTSGRPTQLFTQHSAECPLQGGFAQSLTHASNTQPGYQASWHSFIDPIARVRQVPWYLGAWTQGLANGFAIGIEVAGYAGFTAAQWLTPEGLKQLENLAHEWVYYWRIEKSQGNNIELRWLTTQEVQAVMAGNRNIKGFCTHGQIEPASRWDPGPNFPYDRLMNRIKALINGAPAVTVPKEEDVTTPAQITEIVNRVSANVNGYTAAMALTGYTIGDKKFPGIIPRLEALPNQVAGVRITGRPGGPVSWLQDNANGTSGVERLELRLAAMQEVITELAQNNTVSADEIQAMIDTAVDRASATFADNKIEVRVINENPSPTTTPTVPQETK